MVLKNVVTLLRNIPFLLFMFFMPAFQVIMVSAIIIEKKTSALFISITCVESIPYKSAYKKVCIAIGRDPKGLHFGLVNFDGGNSTNCTAVPGCIVAENYTGSLSCRFLDILESKGTLKLVKTLFSCLIMITIKMMLTRVS